MLGEKEVGSPVILLVNVVHNTKVRLRNKSLADVYSALYSLDQGHLTGRELDWVKRTRSKLCPNEECGCSDNALRFTRIITE